MATLLRPQGMPSLCACFAELPSDLLGLAILKRQRNYNEKRDLAAVNPIP
jgi:hypothetical protein